MEAIHPHGFPPSPNPFFNVILDSKKKSEWYALHHRLHHGETGRKLNTLKAIGEIHHTCIIRGEEEMATLLIPVEAVGFWMATVVWRTLLEEENWGIGTIPQAIMATLSLLGMWPVRVNLVLSIQLQRVKCTCCCMFDGLLLSNVLLLCVVLVPPFPLFSMLSLLFSLLVCRPLPGLTEWSLGNGEYKGKGTLLREQKIQRPQTPARPDEATWSTLQLNYYLPFSENGLGDMRRLQPLIHDCGGATGRYVRVQLHGHRRIFDARVDVVGTKVQLPEGVTDKKDAKLCYGVMAREARSLPTPLMEYEVSEDPNDPVFYSTCYVRELKRLWVKHDWHDGLVKTGDFRMETTCLSCTSYDASITPQNETYVPDWTLDHTCHNCEAVGSTLSYQEHAPIAVNGGPSDATKDGNGTNLAPSLDGAADDENFLGFGMSKDTFVGVAVGGGLLIIVLLVVVVVFVVNNRSERASRRKVSIQLSNTAHLSNINRSSKFYGSNNDLARVDDKRILFDAYTMKRRETGAKRPDSQSGRTSVASRAKARSGTVDERSNWVQHIDEDNEIYYYYNLQTCESVWDPPLTFQMCAWQIEVDEHDAVFYSNETLGRTSWTVGDTQEGFNMENPMM